MSFQGRLFRDFVRLALYRYSGALLSFGASIITARLLTPREYGIVAMISVISGFLMMFLDSGVSAAAIRAPNERGFHRQLQTMVLLIGVTACVSMCLLAWPIAGFYRNPQLFWPSVATGLVAIATAAPIVSVAVLTKELRFREIGISALINTVTRIGLTIGLALMGLSYWSLIVPMALAPLAQRAYLELRHPLGLTLVPLSEALVAFRRTRGLMGHVASFTMANYWARNVDTLMAGRYYGDVATGIFSRAYSLLTLPMDLVTGVYGAVQLPNFQRLRDEGKDMEHEYLASLRVLSLLVFPLATVMIASPHGLARLLWGSDWVTVGDFLPLFGALLSLQAMASTSGTLLIIAGREREFARLGMLNAGLMIAAIVIGAQYSLHVMVVAYALTFTLLCVPVFLYFGYVRALGFSMWRTTAFWVADVAIAAALIADTGFNSQRVSLLLLAALGLRRLVDAATLAFGSGSGSHG